MKKRCCVLIYNSFNDPLFQNLMLKYIITLNNQIHWRFDLITFEQPYFTIPSDQKLKIKEDLQRHNIHWRHMTHRTGRFLLFKKTINLLSLFPIFFNLRLSGTRVLWSFANVAASIAWFFSKFFGFKTIIYSYEPHSDFMVELGIWNRASIKYKLLNYAETMAGLDGDYVLTGTIHMFDKLRNEKLRGRTFRAPTSVDENEFYFRTNAFSVLQKRHMIQSTDKILLYVGKFGGLYYTHEIITFAKVLKENCDFNLIFIVISPNEFDEIIQYCRQIGFDPQNLIYLSNVSYEDVKIYMSGAHLGISAVPPSPSQRFRSPTKVAEYLLCGLPFVTCQGISEDDLVVNSNTGIGIVLPDFSESSVRQMLPEIKSLLNKEKKETVDRCRNVGIKYRGKSNIDPLFLDIFNDLVMTRN